MHTPLVGATRRRQIGEVLDALQITALAAVVSSLPIKWFDLSGQRAIVDACFARMPAEGMFLQLTNALTSPLRCGRLASNGERRRSWGQFPPVQICRHRRAATIAGNR